MKSLLETLKCFTSKSERPKAARTRSFSCASSWTFTCARAPGGVFSFELIDDRPQQVTLAVDGPGSNAFFANEAGGHRWQHVPAHDRRGRVQTSTVTVAVLPALQARDFAIKDSDLEWDKPFCAGGPGGQHQNKTASACRVRHKPSAIVVECRSERSLHQNQRQALEVLRAKVRDQQMSRDHAKTADARRAQVGTGQRADKIRTYREQDDVVIDDRTGKKTSLKRLRRGEGWENLK
jgi:peptide chain release factor 1